MIRVVYHPKYFRVSVRGHARSGEPGRDLVCAAASALAVTLAENVTAMERAGQVRELQVTLRSGLAEVCCVPRAGHRATARLVMNVIGMGWERLAREYPEFLSYEVRI